MAITLAMLSACAFTPAQHAKFAVVASEVVAAVGNEINAEIASGTAAIGGVSATDGDKLKLDLHWDPIIARYYQARRAVLAYAAAAREAEKADDSSLLQAPARQLLVGWAALMDIGERIGVSVPSPPKKLVEFAAEAGDP